MSERTITVIPKKPPIKIDEVTGKIRKQKVCGYARVSTDFEDQKNSFDFQKQEFEERIKQNPEWEFVKMYSDEGISGTNTKHRKGFLEMINDAMAGKIDLILIKSLSRFARNTVDCLSYIRKLAEVGVSVYFEKENITTNRENVDLILTIQAAIAEAESRSISENVKWGVHKRMEKGIKKTPAYNTIGYGNDNDGTWYINKESHLIEKIFEMFIDGFSYSQIVKAIKKMDVEVYGNNKRIWDKWKIYRILRNEKYKGQIIHQKTVTLDVLTHKQVVNDGIEPMYIIDNHHEGIISPEAFDYVQMVLDADKSGMFNDSIIKSNQTPLSGFIICENCGRTLRRIKYPYNQSYVLTCKNRDKNGTNYVVCNSDVIDYGLAEKACLKVLNELNKFDDSTAINLIKSTIEQLETMEFVDEYNALSKEYLDKQNKINKLLQSQVYQKETSKDFDAKFLGLKQDLLSINIKMEELQKLAKENRELKRKKPEIDRLLNNYSSNSIELIRNVISFAIHMDDGSLRFVLKSKTAIKSNYNSIKEIIKKAKPIYQDKVQKGYQTLFFDVVSIGGEDDANCNKA